MNKQEQLNSDKKVLASLEAEYKRVRCQTDSVRAYVTDLNFEDNVPDKEEQWLMKEQLSVYEQVQNNLMNRIRFYRDRVKRDENIKDCSQYKKTDSVYIGVDVSDEGDHGAYCQVDDGNAAVDMPVLTGESLKDLIDYQVIKVCSPKCKDCPCGDGLREYPSGRDASSCVKVELVGGTYLCLAPLPNSIITE